MADAPWTDQPSMTPTTTTTCVLPSAFTASGNAIACQAIGAKLTEVTNIAESLDSILRELQLALDEATADRVAAVGDEPAKPNSIDVSGRISQPHRNDRSPLCPLCPQEWSHRSATNTGNTTDDELFVTASEGTATQHSRSSSYRTASDGGGSRASPWWSSPVLLAPSPGDTDSSDETPAPPIAVGGSGSLDGSEVSFRSVPTEVEVSEPRAGDCAAVGPSRRQLDAPSWSSYCGQVLAKQTLKRCL